MFLQAQPIIVHIEPPPGENAGAINDLTRVIVGSLGVTGAFVVVAFVVGIAIGGALFWLRSRN